MNVDTEVLVAGIGAVSAITGAAATYLASRERTRRAVAVSAAKLADTAASERAQLFADLRAVLDEEQAQHQCCRAELAEAEARIAALESRFGLDPTLTIVKTPTGPTDVPPGPKEPHE